jgi:hypothetical protein
LSILRGAKRLNSGAPFRLKEKIMKFMVLMIPGLYQPGKNVGPGFVPSPEMVEKMMKFNEELTKVGALIALDGLKPLTNGARVAFSHGKTIVTDGPFIETKEVIGGYWMLQFKSKEEAIDWMKRCPAQDGDVIEIRPVFETSDFPADVQRAADNPTVKAQLEKNKR